MEGGDNGDIPQYCSFKYGPNQYLCIGLSNDQKAVILLGAKQSAINWKTDVQNNKVSFSFLVKKQPVYFSYLNQKIGLSKDPFFFDYTTLNTGGSNYTLLGINHKVVVSYILEPATSETDRQGGDQNQSDKLLKLLQELAKQVVILVVSQIILKLLKKTAGIIKDALSKAAKFFKDGDSIQEVADGDVADVASVATETEAAAQQAAEQASEVAAEKAAQRAAAEAAQEAAEKAAQEAAAEAAQEAAQEAAAEAAKEAAARAAQAAAQAAAQEAAATAAETSAWAEAAEIGESILGILLL